MVEQGEQCHVELGRVLKDPAGLVHQLQSLVLLSFGHVRAVSEEERCRRDGEEPDRGRRAPKNGHCQKREARVGDCDKHPKLDHLRELLELRGSA